MLACAEAGDAAGLAALKAAHATPAGPGDDSDTEQEPKVIDPRLVRAYVAHAMLSHPNHAQQIAAHAAADPEGTAELAAEYAAAVDDDDADGVAEPSDIDGDDSEIDEQPEPAKAAPPPVVQSVAAPVPGGRKGRR